MPVGLPGINENSNTQNPVDTGGSATGVTSGTNPYTGWASQFDSNAGLRTIYDSPWALLPNVFKNINQTGPGYQYLQDFGADPLTLFTVMNGGQNPGSGLGANEGDYANFLNNLYRMMGGLDRGANPGGAGRGFSAAELIGNVFNASRGEGKESALGNLLTGGDTNQQMRAIFNVLRDMSNVSMTPIAARGYQEMLQRSGATALNQLLNSNMGQTGSTMNTSVLDTLRKVAPQLLVRER